MKIAIVAIAAIALIGAAIEIVAKVIAKKESDKLKESTPEDRFQYQASGRKGQI